MTAEKIIISGGRGPQGVANPGGSSGAVQYNNGGNFGGVSGITLAAGALKSASFAGGSVTASTPMLSLAQGWNNASEAFIAVDIGITNTASDYSSAFIRGRIGTDERFRITSDDTFVFGAESGTGAESPVGIRRIGGSHVIGVCVGRDTNTGKLADVVRFYWEGGVGGSGIADTGVAVIASPLADNRLSIESGKTIVMISENGRFELERGTLSADRIQITGYIKSSDDGSTIDFNNHATASPQSDPVVSFSASLTTQKVVQFCEYDGSTWTERGHVTAAGNADFDGTLNARLLSTDTFTVATLPTAATAGRRSFVTDALTPLWGATVAGSGAVKTPVYDDGSNWKVG